ncbi:MAG: acyl-CoA thioesterase [Pseudomonadota bacterium]
MYPYLRLALTVFQAARAPAIAPGGATIIKTRCWPWDADPFLELNNGRHLTLFDLGRFAFGMRFGLLPVLRQRRWSLVVGGSTTQYRRRIRLFERFEILTRCLARDEKWFYFEQITLSRGKPCSAAFVRTAVVAGPKGTVPTQEVMTALGQDHWYGTLPDWASALETADRSRPWPPIDPQNSDPQGCAPQVSSSASQ